MALKNKNVTTTIQQIYEGSSGGVNASHARSCAQAPHPPMCGVRLAGTGIHTTISAPASTGTAIASNQRSECSGFDSMLASPLDGRGRKEMAMHICENAAKRITVRVVSHHLHVKLMQET